MKGVKLQGTSSQYFWEMGNSRIKWQAGAVGGVGAGNYGNLLDTGWIKIDPAAGGSHGIKFMFENVDESGYPLYAESLRCRSGYAGAICVGLNVSASAHIAASGQLLGGEFYLQNASTFTIVGVYQSAALHVKSWLVETVSPSASALWIDDESTLGVGTIRMVDITMNGSVVIESVLRVYGGDPGATYLFDFQTCDQGAGAFLTAGSSGGATRSAKLKVRFGSTTGYMSIYTD
jgi:hypothetical protein